MDQRAQRDPWQIYSVGPNGRDEQGGGDDRPGGERQGLLPQALGLVHRALVGGVVVAVAADVAVVVVPVERPPRAPALAQPVQDVPVDHPLHGVAGEQPEGDADHRDASR